MAKNNVLSTALLPHRERLRAVSPAAGAVAVLEELARRTPPLPLWLGAYLRGVHVWINGASGVGKSSTADELVRRRRPTATSTPNQSAPCSSPTSGAFRYTTSKTYRPGAASS